MSRRQQAAEPGQSVERRRPGVIARWAASRGRRAAYSVAQTAGAAALLPIAIVALLAAVAMGVAAGVTLYLMAGGDRR